MPSNLAGTSHLEGELSLEFAQQSSLFQQGKPLVVGVSGGADSICLLHLLYRYASAWQIELHVAHLDHGLRAVSAQDAAFVQALAAEWQLPCHVEQLPPGALVESGENLEAAARNARYTFFGAVAACVGAPQIATAHTADDQAETFLMHLLRGSGLDGLTGMQPRSPLASGHLDRHPVVLLRPLLGVWRTEILRYLNAQQLTWREDITNRNQRFTRNWLRHAILPQLCERLPGAAHALVRTASILSAEAERAEALNQAAFQSLLVAPAQSERVLLSRAEFAAHDIATQRGVIRLAWRQLAQTSNSLTFEQLETLRTEILATVENRGPVPLAAGMAWSINCAQVSLHHLAAHPFSPSHPWLSPGKMPFPLPKSGTVQMGTWYLQIQSRPVSALPVDWRHNADPWTAYIDATAAPLFLNTSQEGQQFAPLGMNGQHKSLGDFFTDRKIHPILRSGWPLIVDAQENVLWVCGLHLSHNARITPKTEQVLHLHWQQHGVESKEDS